MNTKELDFEIDRTRELLKRYRFIDMSKKLSYNEFYNLLTNILEQNVH